MDNFLPEKSMFHTANKKKNKKMRKSDFAPYEKYSSYATDGNTGLHLQDLMH